MYESDDKMVSHPGHYQGANGMEVIDVIEAFTANLTGIEATDTGNIIKYACRWKEKGGVQDLKKIVWYATHLIEKLEGAKQMTAVQGNTVERSLEAMIEGIVFPTQEVAVKLLEDMRLMCKNNGYLMASTFLAHLSVNTRGVEGKYSDGWRNLDDAFVDYWQSDENPNFSGWVIRVPELRNFITEKESN